MDEFDMFRARAYGGYVEPSAATEEEEALHDGLNGNVEGNEWTRRESSGRRRRSVRKSGEPGESSGRWVDRSQSPSTTGERRGSSRSRLNSQVTVAVEPPSPTELSRGDGSHHQRSQSWKARQVRLSPNCYDQDGEAEAEEGEFTTSLRYATPSPLGLHRTRTMPARRSASPRQRSPAPAASSNHPVIVEPSLDSPSSPDGSTEALQGGECKIYRVRSFTTKKKGGGFVNRGDSIKICNNSRRASRCDNLLVAPSGGSGSRRNSTTSTTGRGSSLQPFQPSPLQLRRSSESCIDAPNLDGSSSGVAPTSTRDVGVERRGSQSSTRASCRNIAYDDHDEGAVELIPGRRASQVRRQSPGGETASSSNALWSAEGKVPVNGPSFHQQRDVDVRVNVVNGAGGEEEDDEDEEEDGEEDGGAGDEQVYNVMVVGSHGVGKTTLMHQLLTSEYLANKENYQADHDVGEKTVSVQLDDVESMVHFEDAAFSDDFQSIKDCDEGVDAYLIVYSVTDRSSFAYCQSCLQEIQKRRKRIVAMLVANKQDLVRNRVISEGEGKRLASKRKCEFLEVSALLDHRVDEVLVTIIRLIRQHNVKALNSGGGEGPGSSGRGGGKGRRPASSDDDLRGNRGCIHKAAAAIFRKLFK